MSAQRRLGAWVSGVLAAALVVTVAVVAAGYDSRDTPRVEPGVWVARDAGQYGRVNTDTGELDTVRRVSEPTGVVQSGTSSLVLTHGGGRAWPVQPANPQDLGAVRGADAESEADAGANPDGGAAAGADASAVATSDAAAGTDADAAAGAEGIGLPEGTRDLLVAGRYLALRTEAGSVHVGELRDAAGTGVGADPAALAERLESLRQVSVAGSAQAIALGEDGTLAIYSGEHAVTRLSLERLFAGAAEDPAAAAGESAEDSAADSADDSADEGRERDAAGTGAGSYSRAQVGPPVSLAGDQAQSPQIALVGADWVLLDAADGRLFRGSEDPVQLELGATPLLQASSGAPESPAVANQPASQPASQQATQPATQSGDGAVVTDGDVLIADQSGLLVVPANGEPERVAADGIPARPTEVAGVRYAAWLGPGAGELWRGDELVPLAFDDEVREAGDLTPVFASNGARAVLSDQTTGMLWTIPDGELLPLSQWNLADPPQDVRGTVVVEDVPEQVPPTAVDDQFGARAGQTAPLPVLLNDFDANERDVLTIVPGSLTEAPLPEDFGTVEVLADRQSLVVHPVPGASGSATFSYRITDGVLESESATVTVRIADEAENEAPEWCPVAGCQREWSVPAIAPGGTLVTPVLEAWVDPEGDVLSLVSVAPVRAADPVRALVTAEGELALRHTDAAAGGGDVALRLTVRDSRGAERERELVVEVRADAVPVVTGTAASVSVGTPATLDPRDRVAGGSGSFALLDVAPQSGTAKATLQAGTGTVSVVAPEPGVSTFVTTVRDTVTGAEASGTLRVTATAEGAPLALPPLRAYVRPQADATIEVLDALPGAASRALAVVDATVTEGELQTDVIEHAQVRVAGSTADGGPGRIGTAEVTVAEGAATARGQLSVFQVPEAASSDVIAVPDSATVRAGATVDVRVLDNDVAAPGERLQLHPDVAGSGAAGELAFAAGNVVRYLAPQEPGTYRISYTVYAESAPEVRDTGELVLTVVAPGSNREPQPATLTARVAPGGSVSVPVPRSGIDPDGDRVRLRGVDVASDPRLTATVSATGTAIEVAAATSSEPGTSTLSYTVSDDAGGSGVGTLHVVVTGDGQGAPVARTDQVRLVPGGVSVVQPLDNDVDPSGGTLELVSVEPNVPGGESSAEYARAAAAIDTAELQQGRIRVTAGEQPGTVSYRYTVRSDASSSTADGLIVVRTSERVGAQAPAVRDTVLSVRDRAELEGRGVEVLRGQVRWPAGDPASLKLSLWDEQTGDYRATGGRISGSYDPAGDVVVFRVTGTDASGTEVESFGFLLIPPLDDLRLTLAPDLVPLEVAEGDTVTAAVRQLVDAGPDDRVELRDGVFTTARTGAVCAANGADSIRYEAGQGAPWEDVCRMDVRLRGQSTWTTLPVPVRVIPETPTAELRALTRTLAPGATETINLTDMVQWQGGREGDTSRLRFTVSGGGPAFETVSDGASLRVTARATALPGTQEPVSVSVTGAGSSRSALTLRVGESPRDVPRGGTIALQCTVGEPCATDLSTASGAHDPFAGTSGGGLSLVSVDGAACPVARFAVNGERGIAVSWPQADGPGGACTAGFTVRDAQGRLGAGTIEFDAQGLPGAPASIVQTGFTESSATFQVSLGGRQSYPAVSEVRLAGAGAAECTPAGPDAFSCTATGLRSGERHEVTARTVNAVGESTPAGPVTGWAYRAPAQPTVSAVALPNEGNTDQSSGGLRVSVTGSDDTREFQLTVAGAARGTISGPSGSRDLTDLPVGPVVVEATPVSAVQPPPVGAGSSTGATARAEATVIGAPIVTGATLTSAPGSNRATVTGAGAGAHAGEAVTWRYAVGADGSAPDCRAAGTASGTFTDLPRGAWFVGAACARSPFGVSSAVSAPVQIGGAISPLSATFTVATAPQPSGAGFRYPVEGQPQISGEIIPGASLRYSNTGSAEFEISEQDGPPITVMQCVGGQCSDPGPVTGATAPRPVSIAPSGVCVDPANSSQAALAAAVQISSTSAAGSAQFTLGQAAGSTVPLTVSWGGAYAALGDATLTVDVCELPPPAP